MDIALLILNVATFFGVLALFLHMIWRMWKQTASDTAPDKAQQDALLSLFRSEFERIERAAREETQSQRAEAEERARRLREEVGERIQRFGDSLQDRVSQLNRDNERRQAELRETVEKRLDQLRQENTEKLAEMQRAVDEKLEGTLEKRLGESFKLVTTQLENVQKGLGEMQTLATGVGDLKRVLTNVKSRGTWAEIQLGTLLDEMLTPEQYRKNAQVDPNSRERVEFAIRMPGQGANQSEVLLPIDAKFPQEDFERLMEATDRADKDAAERARKALESRIRAEAERISEKYVKPPHTTDFAVLFLPTEGLFAEIIRRPGLLGELQQQHRVTVTGPTTLSALLNSLQMGFRTLAIQKRSSEVWKVLEQVKMEFRKYGETWNKVRRQLTTVSTTVEHVGTRTRAVERVLGNVGTLEGAAPALSLTSGEEEEGEG